MACVYYRQPARRSSPMGSVRSHCPKCGSAIQASPSDSYMAECTNRLCPWRGQWHREPPLREPRRSR